MATMTEITITERAPTLSRTGRRIGAKPQIWAAESADGVWAYERTETSGTPWVVTHIKTGHEQWFSSLPKARIWTARPEAETWAISQSKQFSTAS
jgi:hypothetical protein